jgi:hypothetical protein
MESYPAGMSGAVNDSWQVILRRNAALKTERSTWVPTWMEIADYIQPRRGRFWAEDKNKGDRKDRAIINNRPTRASRILASGLMAGLTNQARPWFRLTLPDPDLAEYGPVKTWTQHLEDRARWLFQKSNTYLTLHGFYTDLTFGTACMYIEEDPLKVMRSYLFPIGSYCLALDGRGRVNTCYRESQMTVGQLVDRFGLAACSAATRDAYRQSLFDDWRTVLHVIEPNRERKPGMLDRRGKAFRSCWLELGGDGIGAQPASSGGFEQKYLLESGYEENPAIGARWACLGEDVYGSGPGHEAIGDARALQTLERRAGQVVDKIANPATQLPSSLRNEPVSMNPNSHVYVDAMGPQQAVRPVYTPDPRALDSVELKIRQHELRVDQSFFADLWLMIASADGQKMTATEVTRRQEEKMLQLGPVLQRLEDELLDPLIDRALGILFRRGLAPPAPKEVQGMELKVEYVSILAQAQKLVSIQGVHELTAYVTSLAASQQAAGQAPEVLDKFNADQAVDEVSGMLGVPPELVRSDEEVAAIRAQRAQAQARQQQMAQLAQGAQIAKDASAADLEGDNVLKRMLPALGGDRAV